MKLNWRDITWQQLLLATKIQLMREKQPPRGVIPTINGSVACQNCMAYRTVIDGVVERCRNCAAEEIDTNDLWHDL